MLNLQFCHSIRSSHVYLLQSFPTSQCLLSQFVALDRSLLDLAEIRKHRNVFLFVFFFILFRPFMHIYTYIVSYTKRLFFLFFNFFFRFRFRFVSKILPFRVKKTTFLLKVFIFSANFLKDYNCFCFVSFMFILRSWYFLIFTIIVFEPVFSVKEKKYKTYLTFIFYSIFKKKEKPKLI